MNAITFENVSKKFTLYKEQRGGFQERVAGLLRPRGHGEVFWALRDVSFELPEGHSLGLVGHNGSGKSTSLKLMTRILEPTSGRVAVRGRVAALLELGSGFHPDLTGRENVFLNGSLIGFSRRDMQARLDEIVSFAEMEQFIDTEVKHYSSGMYARLAFAVATSVDPDILITDEVLSVGDEAFQRKCEERIYSFRQAGKTIIFVSHALETIQRLCDQVVWLEHGQVQAQGAPGPTIAAYLRRVNQQEQARLEAASGEHSDDDTDDGSRYGSREVEIVGVELLDGRGLPQTVAQTGAPLTIRIHYRAGQPVEEPVFGIGVHHESGVHLSGPNTLFDKVPVGRVDGAGHIDYTVASLPLLAGRYLLSAAIYDQALVHPYDHHMQAFPLVVQSDHAAERFGMLALGGRWAVNDR
jgi:lipopolysaccharide transport system ATP-binding protein